MPKGGADCATPPEGEGNPAEGGYLPVDKIIIDKIRGKGEKEGKDWYRFLESKII